MFREKLSDTDPSQNFIERFPHPLDSLFKPRTVAVIGAKDDLGSVGRTLILNLQASLFQGSVYAVNPKRESVLGLKAYPSVKDIPEKIDLAVIITPAQTIPKIILDCVGASVKGAIIISAGFKELGESGKKLEEEILLHARKGKMAILGPNCLGIMNPIWGLNATFARGMALPGKLAFISQSGAMCTAVLDWSLKHNVGFSSFVSVGSMADIEWGTLIDYLGSDPHTESLLLYMETVGDARSFMTAAREVALEKPIIIIKAGRSQAAAKAAASHTGALAGSDEVFDAALERIGVLRVNSIGELFNMASVLAKQPRPKGPHLTIMTNAGGPGVLATDAVIANQGELASLSRETIQELNHILPVAWSHGNPVDILGDANAERYAKSLDILMRDLTSDGLLVILSPQDMTDATAIANQIVAMAEKSSKPILASWMGGGAVQVGSEILSKGLIPVFEYPDDAAKAFALMWRYSRNLQSLYEVPIIEAGIIRKEEKVFLKGESLHAKALMEKMKRERRTLFSEFESKQILKDYHIPIVETVIASTIEEAVNCAKMMGFPVVLKLFSSKITHKSDVGGVKLNLQSIEEVEKAYHEIKKEVSEKVGEHNFQGVSVQPMINKKGVELILGSSSDPQFGPVILFGMGGQLVEIFKDRGLAIPPLNFNLARQLMEKTKIYEALKGVRGCKPVDLERLEELLIHFSLLVIEHPRIKECDINPLLACEDQIIALDARIVLHDWDIADEDLPQLAIRPYPFQYVLKVKLKNEMPIILRPILPEDEKWVIQFHRELSENSVRQRYFAFVSLDKRVAHERLIRICFNDYDRELAIVALRDEESKKEILGIGRLMRIPGLPRAQLKLIIADSYHHLGLGTQLIKHLLMMAKEEKIEVVDAFILSENSEMIHLCQKFGFELHQAKKSLITHAQWKIERHLSSSI